MTINVVLKGVCVVLVILLSCDAWSAGFNDNGDGTVTDFATGLVWQQSDAHNNSTRTHAQAFAYCAGLSLAGSSSWRLPEVKELASIVELRRALPSIDLANFSNSSSNIYWSSSSLVSVGGAVWRVSFSSGGIGASNTTTLDKFLVRCVR